MPPIKAALNGPQQGQGADDLGQQRTSLSMSATSRAAGPQELGQAQNW